MDNELRIWIFGDGDDFMFMLFFMACWWGNPDLPKERFLYLSPFITQFCLKLPSGLWITWMLNSELLYLTMIPCSCYFFISCWRRNHILPKNFIASGWCSRDQAIPWTLVRNLLPAKQSIVVLIVVENWLVICDCYSMWDEKSKGKYLLEEIFLRILECMSPTIDFLGFDGICRPWQSLIENKNCPPWLQLPWLMLLEDGPTNDIRHFSPSLDKIHNLMLPEAQQMLSCGSIDGWLNMLNIR